MEESDSDGDGELQVPPAAAAAHVAAVSTESDSDVDDGLQVAAPAAAKRRRLSDEDSDPQNGARLDDEGEGDASRRAAFEEAIILFASAGAEAMRMAPAVRSFFFDTSDVGRAINRPTQFSSALLSALQPHLRQGFHVPEEIMRALGAWAEFVDSGKYRDRSAGVRYVCTRL